MPRLTARGEHDHCNENSPVTFASDMSRVPEASMLTGEISSSKTYQTVTVLLALG